MAPRLGGDGRIEHHLSMTCDASAPELALSGT
jgi:hypothetical protein